MPGLAGIEKPTSRAQFSVVCFFRHCFRCNKCLPLLCLTAIITKTWQMSKKPFPIRCSLALERCMKVFLLSLLVFPQALHHWAGVWQHCILITASNWWWWFVFRQRVYHCKSHGNANIYIWSSLILSQTVGSSLRSQFSPLTASGSAGLQNGVFLSLVWRYQGLNLTPLDHEKEVLYHWATTELATDRNAYILRDHSSASPFKCFPTPFMVGT